MRHDNTVDSNIGAGRLFLAGGNSSYLSQFERLLFSSRGANWSLDPNKVYVNVGSPRHYGLFRYFTFNENNLQGVSSQIENYIVLIHGWNPDNLTDPYASGNLALLKSRIQNWLHNNNMTHWGVAVYMMPSDTSTGAVSWEWLYGSMWKVRAGTRSAEVARLHGYHMARSFIAKCPQLKRVHFIAHSAGSWAARSSAEYLLDYASSLRSNGLQISLLDAYVPSAVSIVNQGNTNLDVPLMNQITGFSNQSKIYGLDNYYYTYKATWNFNPPGTANDFSWGGKALSANNVDVSVYPANLTSPSGEWYGHSGPIRYYADSVANPNGFGGAGGWKQSIAFDNHANPPPPDAPAEISYPSSSGSGTFLVSWSASWGATSYRLERSVNGGAWGFVANVQAPTVSRSETVGNGNYRYRVRGVNASGQNGEWKEGSNTCAVNITPGSSTQVSASKTLTADSDTYSDAYKPTQNFGSDIFIPVVKRGSSHSQPMDTIAFVGFNCNVIPSSATITEVQIILTEAFPDADTSFPITLFKSPAFNASTLNHNNKPSLAGGMRWDVYRRANSMFWNWNSSDSSSGHYLISDVQSAVSSGAWAYFAFNSPNSDNSANWPWFLSREYNTATYRPRMAVNYTLNVSVSTPTSVSGPTQGLTGESLRFEAGGSVSSAGEGVQYRFEWGDGTDTGWSSSARNKTYNSPGTYEIRVQARCASHTAALSDWSGVLKTVTVNRPHTVNTPNTPSGPSSGYVGTSYEFSTSGGSCSHGHSVEYQFDWGDGQSGWGGPSAFKSYGSPNTYNVKARSRCSVNTSIVSVWSGTKSVTISPVPTHRLDVSSSGASIVEIESYTGHGGTTPFEHTMAQGTAVDLTAPEYVGNGANRKRFSEWTGAINSTAREISFDMDSAKSLVANYVDAPFNNPPDKPTLISPANGATGVNLTPTLEASAFSDPDPGDTHSGSRWMIINAAGTAIIWDSGIGAAATSVQVPENTLEYSTEYGWSVFYYDSQMETYSTGPFSSFTTMADPAADTNPPTVTITAPTTAATWTSPTNRMNIGGTASDIIGVTGVKVRNFRDVGEYACTGTTSWQYNNLPLFQGQNLITVTARDAVGNLGTDTITVTYNGDTRYGDVLRSGGVMQEIVLPDNLTPGTTVTVRWKVLSYVPVVSRVYAGVPGAWTFFRDGKYTGFEQSPWNLDGRHAGVYAFECEWPVPQKSGEFKLWFNVAQTDAYQFMIPVIPDGVDPRPDPQYAKLIQRTILPGGTGENPESDPDIYDSAMRFENVNQCKMRSSATVVDISMADNLSQGTQVTVTWKVHSYVSVNGQLLLLNLDQQEIWTVASGARVGNPVQTTFNFQDRATGTRHYASEYTFRATFTVPNQPGTQQVFFRCQTSGSPWMAATIAAGIDNRPAAFNGMFGRFIERTINP